MRQKLFEFQVLISLCFLRVFRENKLLNALLLTSADVGESCYLFSRLAAGCFASNAMARAWFAQRFGSFTSGMFPSGLVIFHSLAVRDSLEPNPGAPGRG